MSSYEQTLIIVFGIISIILLIYALFKLVLWARKGGKGAIVVGALFTIFSPDPIFEKNIKIVQESKQSQEEEEDKSGDPPIS